MNNEIGQQDSEDSYAQEQALAAPEQTSSKAPTGLPTSWHLPSRNAQTPA